MKTKKLNKIFALITCAALLFSSVFAGITATADSTSAAEAISSVKFGREPIYKVDFTKYGNGEGAPSDWVTDYEYPFLWRGSGSYINKVAAENYDSDGMGLKIGAVNRVHIFTLPNLGTENYVVTIKASFKKLSGSFGIATDIAADHTAATYASIIEVNPADAKFKTFTRTMVSTWSEDKQKTEPTFEDIACFTGNTVTAFEEITIKAYHLNHYSYFYCNDVYVGEVEDWGNAYSDRIGIYSNCAVAKLYSVEVLGIAGDGPNKVDKARINEEAIYNENFTSYGTGKVLPNGWVNNQYTFLYNNANAMNNLSYGVWKDDNSVKYMTYKGKGGGHIMTLPAMGTENYVYTVRAKMSEYYSGAGVNNVGIVTNIANNYSAATSATIFEVRPVDEEFKVFSRIDDGSSGVDKAAVTVPFTNDYYFNDDTIALNDEIILTAYHINDISYFYCNGIYVGMVEDYANDTLSDRVGLYTYGGNLSIYDITVKEILPTITDIENKTYISKTLISEDFSNYSSDDAIPEGWALNSNSWIWNGSGSEMAFVNKTGRNALMLWKYSGTAVLTLPQLGTSNYVFTANITMRDAQSFGLLTNIDDPAIDSTGATFSLLRTKRDGDSRDEIYLYNREAGGYQYNKHLLNQTNIMGSLPDFNDVYELKVYSYEGISYFFVNDIFICEIEQRNPADTSICGLCSESGTILINKVEVSAISGVDESDSLKMQGAEIKYADLKGNSDTAAANGIRFVANFDATDALYTENYDNVTLGMVIAPASKFAAGEKLTVQTAGAADIKLAKPAAGEENAVLEAEIFNMSAAALNAVYTARAYMLIDNNGSLTYYYSDQISRSPVGVANLFYADTTIEVSDDIKGRLDRVFGECENYLGANDTAVTFTAFSDFHYKEGMYAGTVAGLQKIVDRSRMNGAEFMLQCGDFSNDMKGSPEITNAYLNNTQKLPAYGVYGNHELESAGNSMDVVTPLLTNNNNVVWGTSDTNIGDGSIAYYYFDNNNGFRMIFLDTNYSWNSSKSAWEHNTANSYGPPTGNTKANSLGPVQLEWLEKVLLDAANRGLSCIVASHESFSGTILDVSPDGEAVRAIFRKANNVRPKTVILALNGHQHSDQIKMVDDVVYFNVNTANNGCWISNKTGTQHYSEEHTFEYVKYDSEGNPISTETAPLTVLSGSPSTWYFANPLSATVTVTKSGIVKINGMETNWMYDVVAPEGYDPFGATKISSGIFGCQKEIRPLTLEESAAQKGIAYKKGNRTLVWYDEFDATTLDNQSWNFEQSMSNPDVTYSNNTENVKIANNNLQMNVTRDSNGYVLSQGISTQNTMSFKYGYLEMRAKVPFSHGAWPSLWAKSAPSFHEESVGWGAEVDIFEVFSNETTLYPNIHKYGHNNGPHYNIQDTTYKSNGYTFADTATANDYHIYGFEWTEDYMKFYVDGALYQTYDFANDFAPDLPGMDGYREYIYLIINNEIFTQNSKWKPYAGCEITDSDPLPEYKIDYIRLYQDIQTESILTVK